MALLKSITTHYGVDAEYHRITSVALQAKRQIEYYVMSYTDKAARDAQKAALTATKFHISDTELTSLPGGSAAAPDVLVAACYSHLKKQDDFTGAEDC